MIDQYLWTRLSNYPIGGDKSELFFNQLAYINEWDENFCRMAIQEYQRFLYLQASTDEALAPSPVVDIVWQQHLTFTRSYWKDVCGLILHKDVHRDPILLDNNRWFKTAYSNTLKNYSQYFQKPANHTVWPHKISKLPKWLNFLR